MFANVLNVVSLLESIARDEGVKAHAIYKKVFVAAYRFREQLSHRRGKLALDRYQMPPLT